MTSKTVTSRQDNELQPGSVPEADALHVVGGDFGSLSTEKPSDPNDLPVADRLDENLDEATPNDTILARPEWGSVAMAAMAGSFDMVVPAAMLAANYSLFRNADLRGDGSLTDGSGTLEAAFRNKFEGFDDEGKPKQDEDSLLDNYADMVADERAEQKREQMERDREATLSEAQIDAMEWTGDPNEVWDLGGITASRKTLLAGAKAARTGLKKLAEKDNWSEDQLAHETRLVSDYERAIIENRYDDAAEAKRQMQPDTKETIDQKSRMETTRERGVSVVTSQIVTDATTEMTASTGARSDVLSQLAGADQKATRSDARAAPNADMQHGSALTNPPDIELTEEFSAAASKPESVMPAVDVLP